MSPRAWWVGFVVVAAAATACGGGGATEVSADTAAPVTTGASVSSTVPPATTSEPTAVTTTEAPSSSVSATTTVATTTAPTVTVPPSTVPPSTAAPTTLPAATVPEATVPQTVPPTAAVTFALDLTVGPVPDRFAEYRDHFSKFLDVFGVPIFATAATPDDKVEHAGHVLAQYLDGDDDGEPDDPDVPTMMVSRNAGLVMGATEDDLEDSGIWSYSASVDGEALQDLLADETNQGYRFDATLEEVHHLVFDHGWVPNHPGLLSPIRHSALTRAMDAARGGFFDEVPNRYPDGAWWHYDDDSCEYGCQVSEYVYWAHTTLLGAQVGRCGEIAEEWEPCTAALLRSVDPAVVAILEDPAIGLPTRLPDGNYTGR